MPKDVLVNVNCGRILAWIFMSNPTLTPTCTKLIDQSLLININMAMEMSNYLLSEGYIITQVQWKYTEKNGSNASFV